MTPPKRFPRVKQPVTGMGASLLSCVDVETSPGHQPTGWGEEEYTLVPHLVGEACGQLGISPLRDAFVTPANNRFAAY